MKCSSSFSQPSVEPPAASQKPKTSRKRRSVDNETLKRGPVFCADGKYRWIYELNMWTNPTILLLVCKIFFWIFVGIWAFVTLITICDDGFDWDVIWGNTWPFLILMGVFAIIILLAYSIVAAIYGGKYIVLFEMDDKSITHRQIKEQVKKAAALGWITALTGARTGNLSMMGLGIISATRTSMTSNYQSVRSVQPYKNRNLIKVNERFHKNQVYVDNEHFDFVYEFIRSHCPKVQ